MGKGKKKQFIDKKNAYTFKLVHRSQQDPLIADQDASEHVLKPLNDLAISVQQRTIEENEDLALKSTERRKAEQQKYGIYYDDNYDYLQHLKEKSKVETAFKLIESPQLQHDKTVALKLPSEVFSTAVEEETGMLNKAAPVYGPRLDLDPDIVAAMDDDFDFDEPDNVLEDDFIFVANAKTTCDVVSPLEENSRGNCTRLDQNDAIHHIDDTRLGSHGDEASSLDGFDVKSRFTEYSMTSSIVPRNEGLMMLDRKFEKFMESYDDELVGALDEDDAQTGNEANRPGNDDWLLRAAVEDFERNYTDTKQTPELAMELGMDGQLDSDGSSSSSSLEQVEIAEKPQWDCESILSTHSNLYNHPTKISESPSRSKSKKGTRKPLQVSPGDERNVTSTENITRLHQSHSKDESRYEKRARKQAVRADRKARRETKKCNKIAYKQEELRLSKQILNTTNTSLVV